MDEAALIAELVRRIEAIATKANARRVTGVEVWLGALWPTSADAFAERFARATTGTIVEGARLDLLVSKQPGHRDADALVLRSVETDP